jgi:hypothetical protein
MLVNKFVRVEDLTAAKRILHESLITDGILTSCENCEWSREVKIESKAGEFITFDTLICDKWNTIPPHKIQVFGCSDWEWDIPF